MDQSQPLKGFVPFMDDRKTVGHSMEFFYIPLNRINKSKGVYDYTDLESNISSIASRGHQTVLRVYLDYPEDSESDGCPSYFWSEGIQKKFYELNGNTFYFPDYTDQKCIDYLVDFIRDFGTHYNGDPRIGFIFTGLVGHWGEWHNYYYQVANENENMPAVQQQNQIFDAFATSFDRTFTLTRKPTTIKLKSLANIGFHDDSFTESTLGNSNWYFIPLLEKLDVNQRWMTAPIGGEFRPENQVPFLRGQKYDTYYQDYVECVEATHCSWLLYDAAFYPERTESERQVAWDSSRKLGYDLFISDVNFERKNGHVKMNLAIENRGVAPFYYNWIPDMVLVKNGSVVYRFDGEADGFSDWDLPSVVTGKHIFNAEFNFPENLDFSGCSLCIGVPNPMGNGIALKFSNSTLSADLENYVTLLEF